MSWIGVGVAAVGTIANGVMSDKASKRAANAQTKAADAAAQVQWDMFNQTRVDQAPFRAGGLSAFNEYLANLGITPTQTANALAGSDPSQAYLMANPDVAASGMDALEHYNRYGKGEGRTWGAVAAPIGSGLQGMMGGGSNTQAQAFDKFRNTPGYQFGFDQGQTALTSAANASGGLFSGKAGKALVKFGTDYADQQGYTPYMNRLASAAGLGQTATNQVGNAGLAMANNVGQAYQNAGNARASGIIGSANATGNTIGQLAGLAGYGLANRNTTGSSAPAWWGGGGWGGI